MSNHHYYKHHSSTKVKILCILLVLICCPLICFLIFENEQDNYSGYGHHGPSQYELNMREDSIKKRREKHIRDSIEIEEFNKQLESYKMR